MIGAVAVQHWPKFGHRAGFRFPGLKSTKARYIAKEIYIQAGNVTSAKKPGYLRLPGLVRTPGYTLYTRVRIPQRKFNACDSDYHTVHNPPQSTIHAPQLLEWNYLRSYGLQTLRYQRTTKTTWRQSWVRTGCRPRCASVDGS